MLKNTRPKRQTNADQKTWSGKSIFFVRKQLQPTIGNVKTGFTIAEEARMSTALPYWYLQYDALAYYSNHTSVNATKRQKPNGDWVNEVYHKNGSTYIILHHSNKS